jgi:K+-sensing histidine kinase KdpD
MQRRSSRDWSSRAWRYGFAAGVVGLALLLSATMTWMWGGKLPGFLLLYPAVLVAAWAGGPGPGLLATVLSCLAISYFWLPPTYSFEISDIADLIGLVIFSIVCLFITALSEMNRRHETAIMVALRQSE